MLWLTEKTFLISQKKWFNNIWKHSKDSTGQGDNYTTGCLLDYDDFKNCYKMIVVDLGKEQALDVDPKAIQQINFTGILDPGGQTAMLFIIEEAKEAVLDCSQGTVRVL